MLSLIVAVDQNNLIGNNNQLPWHLPADLKYFKATTMGYPIIMGRKTFESIGKPLPGRRNLIVTRNTSYKAAGCEVYYDLVSAVTRCVSKKECFVIGGAELFTMALPYSKKLYMTKVHHSFEGDTHFPEIKPNEWQLVSETHHKADEVNKYDYSFLIYSRI